MWSLLVSVRIRLVKKQPKQIFLFTWTSVDSVDAYIKKRIRKGSGYQIKIKIPFLANIYSNIIKRWYIYELSSK